MRKSLLTIVAVVAAGLVVVAVGAAGSYRGVEPVVVAGSPKCGDLGLKSSTEVKFVSPVNGMSAGGIHLFVDTSDPFVGALGWYVVNHENVRAVIAKGGPNANVYRYPGGDFSDGLLTTPTNPKNGTPYDLGYVTFCYDPPA
jgi:hypothetical protein